ncbi:MAG: cytochrome b [Burkholderiales bacterium]
MIGNTKAAWGWASQAFHWIGAALVLVLLAHGEWMADFAPREVRFEHYLWHASVGYALLALVILRLLWRWTNAVPELPRTAPAWERVAAHLSHWGLYVLILAASLSGWALAGTFSRPMDATLFGLVHVPGIVGSRDRALHDQLESGHGVLAWALAILVVVHFVGALYHLLVRKDDVMQRMLPGFGRGGAGREGSR